MEGKTNPFSLTIGKQTHRLVLRREKTEQIINDFTIMRDLNMQAKYLTFPHTIRSTSVHRCGGETGR